MLLEKYTFGVGDRFAHQAAAQLRAFELIARYDRAIADYFLKSEDKAAVFPSAISLQLSRREVLRYGVMYLRELEDFPQVHIRGVVRQQNPRLIAQIEELEEKRRDLIKRSRSDGLSGLLRRTIQETLASVKETLEPLYCALKQKEAELVRGARVVGCTLYKASIAPDVYERSFDSVLIDEASMAYIPHCAFVAGLAKRGVAV